MSSPDALARDPAVLAAELLRLEPDIERDAIRVVRAPGRVNLIGEHTDYNDGFVLPAAIEPSITIALAPREDRRVRLTLAASGEPLELDLDRLPPRAGSWVDYVVGTAWAIEAAGGRARGFTGFLAADLPIGAGLASSAALELAVAWALGGGAQPLDDKLGLVRAARRAENEHVGVPSGVMDQFAVAFGARDAAVLLDCRSLGHRIVPIPPEIRIVVADSGVSRKLASSAYATRRAECEAAVEGFRRIEPGVQSLRDVDAELLAAARRSLHDVSYRRARHVVTENRRVHEVAAALDRGDLAALAASFAASHASLRDDFEVSTPDLDRLVAIAAATPGVVGARLTGAGFGGATVSLVRAEAVDDLVGRLRRDYRTPAGAEPEVRAVRASHGVELVWPER